MAVDWQFHLVGASAGAWTTATAGTGDAPFDTLQGTGHTIVADAPAGTGLTHCAQMAQVASNQSAAYKNTTSRTAWWLRYYHRITSPFTATSHNMHRVSIGTTRGFDLSLNSLQKYRLFDAANTQRDQTADGSTPLNTWVRTEVEVRHDYCRIRFFNLGQTVPFEEVEYSGAANVFGASFDRNTFGNFLTTPTAEPLRIAGITLDNAAMPAPLESVGAVGGWKLGSIAM